MRSLSEAFGEGRLYVELTDDETAAGRRNVGKVAAFARDAGVPVVATGEVAYLSPADHRLHEVLVAAANLTASPGPEYRPTDRIHLRSAKEMRRLFAGYPDALANAAGGRRAVRRYGEALRRRPHAAGDPAAGQDGAGRCCWS